ncbi:MAG: hypothetical protein J0I41_19955 [Filimonas sp.]|nr:hypothetical protein [Filimonas sp.]
MAYRDRYVHIDSIAYNSNGQLTTLQWGEVENTQNKVVNVIGYNNNGYDAVKYAIHLSGALVVGSDTIPYTIKNNRPAIMVKHTGTEDYDSTTYSYDSDGDLIQQLRKRQSGTYLYSEQLNETYTARYINPYSTVGDQLFWSLLYDSPILGAQKMFATEVRQMSYSGNSQTNTSSFSVDAANGKYPTSVTLTEADGSKLVLKFNYISK